MSDKQEIFVGCMGVTPKADLKPDADGWFTVTLAQFALPAARGINGLVYNTESSRAALQAFVERTRDGLACGYGMPRPLPSESSQDFLRRLPYVDSAAVCLTIRDAELVESDENLTLRAQAIYNGPMAPVLAEYLEGADVLHMGICCLTDGPVESTKIFQVFGFNVVPPPPPNET